MVNSILMEKMKIGHACRVSLILNDPYDDVYVSYWVGDNDMPPPSLSQ
jgi:hypothetical protein